MYNVINVQCQFGIAGSIVKHFTDGKVYEATHYGNALYFVKDDFGNVRYIIPNRPCPHLPPNYKEPYSNQMLGRFVIAT